MSTGFIGGVPKEVFVVHCKSDKTHAALVALLGPMLASFGRSLWQYSDWEWETERKVRSGYAWTGSAGHFNPMRMSAGEAPFLREKKLSEIDKATLDQLLQASRVLVLLAPLSGQLSAGCLVEVERITALNDQEKAAHNTAYRPLIVEAGWTSELVPEFAPLSPTAHVTLWADPMHDAVSMAAIIVSAWVVHTLQTSHGVCGQHLLSHASPANEILDSLITRSPNYRKLDFSELEKLSKLHEHKWRHHSPLPPELRIEKSAPGIASLSNDGLDETLQRMALKMVPARAERFSKWLDRELVPVCKWIYAQPSDREEVIAARVLLQCVTDQWRDSFTCFRWAETVFH